jgi:hypothetical protein
MKSKETRKITVEVLANGKNFVGKSILQERLDNTASLSCANSPTAGTQDSKCNKNSKANTTVGFVCEELHLYLCLVDEEIVWPVECPPGKHASCTTLIEKTASHSLVMTCTHN